MSKETIEMIGVLAKSGIVKAAFIFCIIIVLLMIGWAQFNSTVMYGELVKQNKNVEHLINEQAEIKVFKKCVKKEYDSTMGEFNGEFIKLLGEFMAHNNILFPQEINISIQEFRKKAERIKDCLIFPEEME